MTDNHTELGKNDGERLRAVLHEDERVVLVVKPRARLFEPLAWLDTLFAVAACVVACVYWKKIYFEFPASWDIMCTLSSVVLVILLLPLSILWLVMLFAPLLQLWRKRRTLYVITDKRALILEPSRFLLPRKRSFPLFPNPVRRMRLGRGGYGDIVLGEEAQWQLRGKIRREYVPVGFFEVPQVQLIRQVMDETAAQYHKGAE